MLDTATIVDEWFARTVLQYPQMTADFLRGEADAFRNPAGYRLRDALGVLFAQVEGEMDRSHVEAALDDILRLRSVQDMAPSQAVGFVLLLRDILDDKQEDRPARMHRRIERLLLMAFDHYVLCREDLARVREAEAQRAQGRDRQKHRGRT